MELIQRRCLAIWSLSFCLVAAAPARGDAVTDWNAIAETTAATAGAPPIRARITAMTQIAVHDALNAIGQRYQTYLAVSVANAGASPEAAVATAAYTVLSQALPGQAGPLFTTYTNWMAGRGPCPAAHPSCVADGIAAGESAAWAILIARTGDGSATPHLPYTLAPGPGVFQPTPPSFTQPQFAGWASVVPFALNSGSQFRADPSELFDLTGTTYTRDFLEVRTIGAADAETAGNRSAEQSAIARFWPGAGASWNAIARLILAGRGLDMWEHARLLALLNMALSDSSVSVFDTKYAYNFWRPTTAIRNADTDGNPLTTANPAWLSYQTTPAYPDYVCGLTTNAGSAAEVLRRYFRTDALPFTFTANAVTRSYATLSQATAEAVDARVFGGMHFRTGCTQGLRQGEQVGRFVIQHQLKALVGRAAR